MSEKTGRWAGRNSDKDAVRGAVWDALEDGGMAMGPTWSHIPNFIGADMAAWRLAQTEAWKRAKVVKCNPDPPQIPIRLRALYEGKMLYAPVPWIGVKGINHLARRVTRLSARGDGRYTRLFLGNIVRMQEEIGTGGGGFRFMYASFLQEAHQITGWPALQEASARMTAAGDAWRDFALACARIVKSKNGTDPAEVAPLLKACGENERQLYKMLKSAV